MKTLDQHLADDQLEDLLIGDAAPEATAHLLACPQCRARQTAFLAVVADFNQSTLDWARTRAAAAPAVLPSSTRRPRLFSAPAYALAAAMLVLFSLLFAGVAARHPAARQNAVAVFHPAAPVAAADLPEAQIAEDNHLLAQIDLALDQPDPTPVGYDPEPVSALDAHTRPLTTR